MRSVNPRMDKLWRKTLLTLQTILIVCISACGDGPEAETFTFFTVNPGCSTPETNDFVFRTTQDWYLYAEDIPVSISPAAFSDSSQLLDAMTAPARSAGHDRLFSVLTTVTGDNGLFSQGQFLGFGLTFKRDIASGRIFVVDVLDDSPAAAAGFLRGDEILSLGERSDKLISAAQLLAQPGDGLTEALGPVFPGISRSFDVRAPSGERRVRTLAKAGFPLKSVPVARVFERPGLSPVGYLQLRSFVATGADEIRAALDQFAARNVTELILDVRYNSGGLLRIAELLLDRISAGRRPAETMFETVFRPSKAASSQVVKFAPPPEALAIDRVVFLTTSLTASASELLINALYPYVDTAVIGERTLGKPVGSLDFDMPGCDVRLKLIAFEIRNSQGRGGYFSGLPDANYTDTFCPVTDDLRFTPDDARDPLTREALSWLASNACSLAATSAPNLAQSGGDRESLRAGQSMF